MNWKSVALHAALILTAWLIGSGLFGLLPVLIASQNVVHDSGLMERAETGFETFGIWVVYRIGARLLRFPRPQGVTFTLIRLTWCFFAYVIVGGSVELAFGHPTIAAGLAGIPLAIVVFFLPRPKKSPELVAQ